MRLDIKFAIFKSGRPQYEIAQAIGVSEYTLSKYVRGRGKLSADQEARLRALLDPKGESRHESEAAVH
jgi:plasmid maintenance system antidote protein VapI